METLTAFLASPISLVIWAALVIPSEIVLLADLRRNNAHLMSLMKLVWALTVLYSGPIGLLIYWSCGRKEISTDSLPRRAFRSVAHCYSGCGLGEVTGLIIAVGLLQLSTPWVAGITFALAYVAGFALTVGPLMQDGVALDVGDYPRYENPYSSSAFPGDLISFELRGQFLRLDFAKQKREVSRFLD